MPLYTLVGYCYANLSTKLSHMQRLACRPAGDTLAFGATVAAPLPTIAFGLPRLLVGSAPLFASCNNPTQKCVAARRATEAQQIALTRKFLRTCGGGTRRRPCVYDVGVRGELSRKLFCSCTPLVSYCYFFAPDLSAQLPRI